MTLYHSEHGNLQMNVLWLPDPSPHAFTIIAAESSGALMYYGCYWYDRNEC